MAPTPDAIQQIAANQIYPGPNDRTTFNEEQLVELAASINASGLAQPVVVRPICVGAFEIIAGERRYRAMSQLLGWVHIPCLVRQYSDEEASSLMLTENLARADLSPIEEARAYASRMAKFDWSDAHLASLAGVSVERVKRRLGLLQLIEPAQHLVATGNLGLGHAEALVKLDNNRQISALRILQSSKVPLTVTAFRDICNQLLAEQQQDALFVLTELWVQQLETAAPLPRRGKLAITGAPVSPDLPKIEAKGTDTTGSLFEKYILALQAEGRHQEAVAVGTLYDALVRTNYVAVPEQAQLLKRQEEMCLR